MHPIPNLHDDPFIQTKLNPLFLENLNSYWNTLKNAQVSDIEKIQIQEALYNLVRFTFRRLFQPLYLKYSPKVSGRAFLLSAVHSDGIGDYITTLKCAQLLKEYHSEIDVHVALYSLKQKLPPLDPSFSLLRKEHVHDFQETPDSSSFIREYFRRQNRVFLFARIGKVAA